MLALIALPFVLLFMLLRGLWWVGALIYRHYKDTPESRQIRQKALRSINVAAMPPIAFERHCAAVIAAQGWKSQATRASGDYGADIVAELDGVRIVVQVKKWRAPVNLSAVQEIATAKAHYKAHAAFVVSVSGYRPSAQNLARSNMVILLSYDDLYDISRRVPALRA